MAVKDTLAAPRQDDAGEYWDRIHASSQPDTHARQQPFPLPRARRVNNGRRRVLRSLVALGVILVLGASTYLVLEHNELVPPIPALLSGVGIHIEPPPEGQSAYLQDINHDDGPAYVDSDTPTLLDAAAD